MSTKDNTPGLVVLAIDDEPNNLDEIGYLLGDNPRVRRVLLARDATEALGILRGTDPEVRHRLAAGLCPVDAVFADIQMPGLSGLELARIINNLPQPPILIFVTGHQEYALGAYEVGALGYIVKPPNEHKVEQVLDRIDRTRLVARQEATSSSTGAAEDEVIPVELAGTVKLVPRASVRYVEAQGDYARLHTADGSHLVRIPLAQLEEKWADAGFVRIHRSYLVALPLITELKMVSSGYTVRLGHAADAPELPVSRRHTRELKDRLVRAPKNNWGQR